MPWVLVDVLIGLFAVALLVVALLTGYLRVKQLLRTAKASGKRVSEATAEIDALQSQGPRQRTP